MQTLIIDSTLQRQECKPSLSTVLYRQRQECKPSLSTVPYRRRQECKPSLSTVPYRRRQECKPSLSTVPYRDRNASPHYQQYLTETGMQTLIINSTLQRQECKPSLSTVPYRRRQECKPSLSTVPYRDRNANPHYQQYLTETGMQTLIINSTLQTETGMQTLIIDSTLPTHMVFQSSGRSGAATSPEQAPDGPTEGAGHPCGAVHRHGEAHHEDRLRLRQVPGQERGQRQRIRLYPPCLRQLRQSLH